MKNLFSVLLITLALSSCDNGGGGGNPAPLVDVNRNTKANSCIYKYNEGGTAPTALPSPLMKASIFQKQFNVNYLNAVLDVNAAETARFGKMTGVTFYKVVSEDALPGCLFTNTLPAAPQEIEKQFRQSEDEVKERSNGQSALLAFYLDRTNYGPAIVIKDDGERYTMIHELMHHLFAIGRPVSAGALGNAYYNAGVQTDKAVEKFKSAPTAMNLTEVVNKYEALVNHGMAYMHAYVLEDMAIEYELNDKYQQGNFKYVTKGGRNNGDWYLKSTGDRGLQTIKESNHESNLDVIAEVVEKNEVGLTEEEKVTLNQKITDSQAKISQIKKEIVTYSKEAQVRLDKGQYLVSRIVGSDSISTPECAHADEAFRLMKQVNSRIPRLK